MQPALSPRKIRDKCYVLIECINSVKTRDLTLINDIYPYTIMMFVSIIKCININGASIKRFEFECVCMYVRRIFIENSCAYNIAVGDDVGELLLYLYRTMDL